LSDKQTHSGHIAAVVVSDESAATLEACLQHLREASDVCQIRVIDNDSKDGSQEIIQRQALSDFRLRFIINPNNPGFAAARNQGAKASNAPWLAFIHPDLRVEMDTLARLRELGESLGDCVLGVEQVDEHGVLDSSIRQCDPDFRAILRHPFRTTFIARDGDKAVQFVPALSGGVVLMPRHLFERLNGWDETYHGQVANLDLCRRARETGAIVAIANRLKVVRLNEIPSRLHSFAVQWHQHWDLWRYFCTFQAQPHSLLVRMTVAAAISARGMMAFTRALLLRF